MSFILAYWYVLMTFAAWDEAETQHYGSELTPMQLDISALPGRNSVYPETTVVSTNLYL